MGQASDRTLMLCAKGQQKPGWVTSSRTSSSVQNPSWHGYANLLGLFAVSPVRLCLSRDTPKVTCHRHPFGPRHKAASCLLDRVQLSPVHLLPRCELFLVPPVHLQGHALAQASSSRQMKGTLLQNVYSNSQRALWRTASTEDIGFIQNVWPVKMQRSRVPFPMRWQSEVAGWGVGESVWAVLSSLAVALPQEGANRTPWAGDAIPAPLEALQLGKTNVLLLNIHLDDWAATKR